MNSNIETICMVVGDIGVNCYLIYNKETKETLCIDPGGDAERIYNTLKDNGLRLIGILLTHGHSDHIFGVDDLKNLAGEVPVYIGVDEAAVLASVELNLSPMFGHSYTTKADVLLNDLDTIELLGTKIQVLATPGHTKGSVSFYFPQFNAVFSGDTLFEGSIGRTDFPTGDFDTLAAAIKEKLYTLPLKTTVCSGHGNTTTIEYEKSNNPFVRG